MKREGCTLEGNLSISVWEVCASQVPQQWEREREMQLGNWDKKGGEASKNLRDPRGCPMASPFIGIKQQGFSVSCLDTNLWCL